MSDLWIMDIIRCSGLHIFVLLAIIFMCLALLLVWMLLIQGTTIVIVIIITHSRLEENFRRPSWAKWKQIMWSWIKHCINNSWTKRYIEINARVCWRDAERMNPKCVYPVLLIINGMCCSYSIVCSVEVKWEDGDDKKYTAMYESKYLYTRIIYTMPLLFQQNHQQTTLQSKQW